MNNSDNHGYKTSNMYGSEQLLEQAHSQVIISGYWVEVNVVHQQMDPDLRQLNNREGDEQRNHEGGGP